MNTLTEQADEKVVNQRIQHLKERRNKRIEKLDKLEVIYDKCTMDDVRKLVPEHSTLMVELVVLD